MHWVVRPAREESLAVLFRRVHGRYAQYLNARRKRTGHLWQNRFYSCAVAPDREEAVLRYAEWNPVRAGIAEAPEAYRWLSAAAHLAGPGAERIPVLDWDYWAERGGAEWWRENIGIREDTRDAVRVRQATYAGAPLGPAAFVESMERQFGRQWRKPGRPVKKEVASEMVGAGFFRFGWVKRGMIRLSRFPVPVSLGFPPSRFPPHLTGLVTSINNRFFGELQSTAGSRLIQLNARMSW